MKQHPMVKAYVKAFCASGGKEFKNKFNMYETVQRITFGHCTFHFRIESVNLVSSYNRHLIPKDASRFDVVMIPDVMNDYVKFLPCDNEYKIQYEKFISIVSGTIAKEETI